MKWGRMLLAVTGLTAVILLVAWWLSDRQIPSLRFSHTLGEGSSVSVEWIELS